MSEVVFLVEEDPEEGYTARALGESIFTEADTLDELKAMIRDAVQCHFEEADGQRLFGFTLFGMRLWPREGS